MPESNCSKTKHYSTRFKAALGQTLKLHSVPISVELVVLNAAQFLFPDTTATFL